MEGYRTAVARLRHPVNVALHTNAPLGVRIANAVTGFMGSWRFIILQPILVAVWVAGNVYELFHFDPYPFILLNLVLSTLAALQAPVIMMSQNRQAAKDRLKADLDYEVNLKAELEIAQLHSKAERNYEQMQAHFARIERQLGMVEGGAAGSR